MEEDLRAYLLSCAGVVALVGERVAWGERPQGDSVPGVAMFVISAPRKPTLSGLTRTVGYLVQFECYGRTYQQTRDLAKALGAALQALDRRINPLFENTVPEGERAWFGDGPDGPDLAGAGPSHRIDLDVRVWSRHP